MEIKQMKIPHILEEIIRQQRLILEMHKDLIKILAYPPIIYKCDKTAEIDRVKMP